MGVTGFTAHRFFGLLELDAAGTVLYARAEGDGDGSCPPVDLAGRNFYTDCVPFKNVEDFRLLLDRFAGSSDQASSSTFVCEYEDGDVPVKVLLARIRESSDNERTKAILVHIRKSSSQ
jgi:hypothetical protein